MTALGTAPLAGGRQPRADGPGPPRPLVVHAAVTGLVFALPAVFVVVRAVGLGGDVGETFAEALGPLVRTVVLATSVSATAAAVATPLAWLLVRAELPARGTLRVLLVLPIVLPSFIGAAAFQAAVAPGGLVAELSAVVGVERLPEFRGFAAAWLVLSAFTYPYVLLPTVARATALSPSLEESARLLGRSPFGVFFAVTLPQLRSAVLAGALLVYLYTVSDFGAVQLLGYDTLTRVIFATRLTDRAVSFVSAALLIVLAVSVVAGERRLRRDDAPDEQATGGTGPRLELGRWRLVAAGGAWLLVTVGLFLPLGSLALWATRGLLDGRLDLVRLVAPIVNTATAGLVTAVVAVMIVVPIAVLTVRYRSRAATLSAVSVVAGFAVPGIVIALALVFWSLNTPVVWVLYQTFPLLIMAYVIHFGSQALGAAETAVRAVPPNLRDSARLLEVSAPRRRRLIELPLMRPGLLSGGGLVMLATVKELPVTLLLAPIGFKTLATEVWGAYEEGFFAQAGAASLMLVVVSGALTWQLVLRRHER